MNEETFKKLLARSNRKIIIAGLIPTIMGACGVIAILNSNERPTSYWIFSLSFLIIGLLILVVGIRGMSLVKSGKLPLLKAIAGNQRDYIVWIYRNDIVTKVEGVNAGKSANVVLYNKHGKMTQIVLGRKVPADTVIDYLAGEFPDAWVGYADDTRAAVSKHLNKKV